MPFHAVSLISTRVLSDAPSPLPIAIPVGLVLAFAAWVWSAILEQRYIGPYTLAQTSPASLWRRSAILGGWRTLGVALMTLGLLLMGPDDKRWSILPVCAGIWLLVFIGLTIQARAIFDFHLRRYRRVDAGIKKGIITPNFITMTGTRFLQAVAPSEVRRFMQEGYPPDDTPPQTDKPQ